MKYKLKVVIHAIITLFFLSSICITLTAQDKTEVWVHLDVESLYEQHFLAGDPPTRVNVSSNVSFTQSGSYTINRIKTGRDYIYMAVQDFGASGPRERVPNLRVIQSHPCMDGQSLLIGRAEKEIPAQIYKARVTLDIKPSGQDKVRIRFFPVELDLEGLDCSNPQCLSGFGFTGVYDIGEDPESVVEDEHGYEEIYGYELMEIDFQLLQDIGAGGGEIPLTIPISVYKTYSEVHETPTGPMEDVYNFRVTGWIGTPPADK